MTRCQEEHNPSVWPYVARCTKDNAHQHDEHINAVGRTWTTAGEGEGRPAIQSDEWDAYCGPFTEEKDR
jgi:hypothetical protein